MQIFWNLNVMPVVSMHDKENGTTIAMGKGLLDSEMLVCSIQSD